MSQATTPVPSISRNLVLIARRERKQWKWLYKRVGKPAVAAEVIDEFSAQPGLKQAFPALYLHAKVTLRKHAERQQRNRRIANVLLGLMGKELPTFDTVAGGVAPSVDRAGTQTRAVSDLGPEFVEAHRRFVRNELGLGLSLHDATASKA